MSLGLHGNVVRQRTVPAPPNATGEGMARGESGHAETSQARSALPQPKKSLVRDFGYLAKQALTGFREVIAEALQLLWTENPRVNPLRLPLPNPELDRIEPKEFRGPLHDDNPSANEPHIIVELKRRRAMLARVSSRATPR
jgi:hypothetical protein